MAHYPTIETMKEVLPNNMSLRTLSKQRTLNQHTKPSLAKVRDLETTDNDANLISGMKMTPLYTD